MTCEEVCDKLKVPKSQYTEFAKGFETEKEHKELLGKPMELGQFVVEHLKEDAKYYTKLELMLKKSKNA